MIEGYLDITNINREFFNLHPCTEKLWEDEDIKKEFMEFLGIFARKKSLQ